MRKIIEEAILAILVAVVAAGLATSLYLGHKDKETIAQLKANATTRPQTSREFTVVGYVAICSLVLQAEANDLQLSYADGVNIPEATWRTIVAKAEKVMAAHGVDPLDCEWLDTELGDLIYQPYTATPIIDGSRG